MSYKPFTTEYTYQIIDDIKEYLEKTIEYMNNYIEVENAPINERIKTEFKEVIKLLLGDEYLESQV